MVEKRTQHLCAVCRKRLDQHMILPEPHGERGSLDLAASPAEAPVQENGSWSSSLQKDYESAEGGPSTFGARLADRVAAFGGSWSFIVLFAIVIGVWMALNSWALLGKAFDPYPYVFLNLILSCLAAFQAPVIMMSQNRQSDKDRRRAELDCRVNLRAEREIRALHRKVDKVIEGLEGTRGVSDRPAAPDLARRERRVEAQLE